MLHPPKFEIYHRGSPLPRLNGWEFQHIVAVG